MKQSTDYVKREERVPPKTDLWLLVLWGCSSALAGWMACMFYYGINLL